jgi:hypothetical protein
LLTLEDCIRCFFLNANTTTAQQHNTTTAQQHNTTTTQQTTPKALTKVKNVDPQTPIKRSNYNFNFDDQNVDENF